MNERIVEWISKASGPGDREFVMSTTTLGLELHIAEWRYGRKYAIKQVISPESMKLSRCDIVSDTLDRMIDEAQRPRTQAKG